MVSSQSNCGAERDKQMSLWRPAKDFNHAGLSRILASVRSEKQGGKERGREKGKRRDRETLSNI